MVLPSSKTQKNSVVIVGIMPTISSTRQLFPEAVFESVFTHVFLMCVKHT